MEINSYTYGRDLAASLFCVAAFDKLNQVLASQVWACVRGRQRQLNWNSSATARQHSISTGTEIVRHWTRQPRRSTRELFPAIDEQRSGSFQLTDVSAARPKALCSTRRSRRQICSPIPRTNSVHNLRRKNARIYTNDLSRTNGIR